MYKCCKNGPCLSSISWTNWSILTKFDLDFQIVTLKNLSAPYPSNQMMDSGKPYVLYCWNN